MDYNLQCVDEWRNKQELVDWKAMALSLSYENKMLRTYLKELHMEMINREMSMDTCSYNNSTAVEAKEPEKCFISNNHLVEYNLKFNVIKDPVFETKTNTTKDVKYSKRKNYSTKNATDEVEEPENFCPVDRSKILKEMYGTAATQIAGFETALQLNYEHMCAKLNAKHWPELQLNLG